MGRDAICLCQNAVINVFIDENNDNSGELWAGCTVFEHVLAQQLKAVLRQESTSSDHFSITVLIFVDPVLIQREQQQQTAKMKAKDGPKAILDRGVAMVQSINTLHGAGYKLMAFGRSLMKQPQRVGAWIPLHGEWRMLQRARELLPLPLQIFIPYPTFNQQL